MPATAGREAAPRSSAGPSRHGLRARPDSPNDPAEGRIELVRDGDWLKANGTTLGADDGVAIAAMMALVEDASLPHGPLELLMTVAEEVGLEGANGLDPALVTGSILINLDSEEDGRLTVGCAGSTDTWIRIDAPREPRRDAVTLAVTASGGLGGHSGIDIAARPLQRRSRCSGGRCARRTRPCRSGSSRSTGGKSRNAIPRDARRGLLGGGRRRGGVPRGRRARGRDDPRRVREDRRRASRSRVSARRRAADAWTDGGDRALLDAVALVPTGPLAMSPDFDGLVETSSSLGEAITEGDTLTLHSLSRSSNDAALPEVIATLDAAARLAGGELEVKHNYGGWRPDLDSPVLAAAKRVVRAPVRRAADRHGRARRTRDRGHRRQGRGLDMLSFGPQIESPHSPDERVSIPTVERFWRLLVGVVDELSEPGGAA